MYYLVKDGKRLYGYYKCPYGMAIGEWTNDGNDGFEWQEDYCVFGNIIAEFETESELIKAFKDEIEK